VTPQLTPEGFAAETGVSRETLARLTVTLAVLERWQKRINLVGRATLADPWRRHMLDSAQIAPLIPENARVLVDLGSGAGFPGLVLAIMIPDLEVHLIESDVRKSAFLREAARESGTPVTIHNSRAESISGLSADVVTARAMAPLPKLLELAARFLGPTGQCLFLKGEDVERELTESSKQWTMRVERIPSRSDPAGVILRLREIVHERPHRPG